MGRKVKRTTRLYGKKRSRGFKIFTTVLTVIIAAALVVVGYSFGKTVVDYFSKQQNPNETSDPAWTPPVVSDTADTSATPTTAPPENPTTQTGTVYYLGETATASKAAYEAAIKQAAESGAEAVVIPMKNNTGTILYKTAIKWLDTLETQQNRLSAKELADTAKAAGLKPIAQLSLLKDHITPTILADTTYMFKDESYSWLDNSAEKGGKAWLNPFTDETQAFAASLAAEINAGGFEKIIVSDVVFPIFKPYDIKILPDEVNDSAKRIAALEKTLKSFLSSAQNAVFEIGAEDFLTYDNGFLATAEIAELAKNNPDLSFTVEFNASISRKIKASSGTEITLSSDNAECAKQVFEKITKTVPAQSLEAVISSSGLSEAQLAEIEQALTDMGVKAVTIRR